MGHPCAIPALNFARASMMPFFPSICRVAPVAAFMRMLISSGGKLSRRSIASRVSCCSLTSSNTMQTSMSANHLSKMWSCMTRSVSMADAPP